MIVYSFDLRLRDKVASRRRLRRRAVVAASPWQRRKFWRIEEKMDVKKNTFYFLFFYSLFCLEDKIANAIRTGIAWLEVQACGIRLRRMGTFTMRSRARVSAARSIAITLPYVKASRRMYAWYFPCRSNGTSMLIDPLAKTLEQTQKPIDFLGCV
jgi:hypothetical protein